MKQTCIVVFCVYTFVCASWIDELTNNGKGLQLGNGITLHLDKLNQENVSIFSKVALRLNYDKFGLSLKKASDADALNLGLYIRDNVEGRGKKVDEITIPAIIGFKVTAIAALFFSAVAFLVLKAFALSNLSAAVAVGIIISKYLMLKSPSNRIQLEQSQHPYYPSFYTYPSSMGYSLNDIANYYSYQDYELPHLHRSVSKGQYSVVETPEEDSNSTESASERVDRRKLFFHALPLRKPKVKR